MCFLGGKYRYFSPSDFVLEPKNKATARESLQRTDPPLRATAPSDFALQTNNKQRLHSICSYIMQQGEEQFPEGENKGTQGPYCTVNGFQSIVWAPSDRCAGGVT
jgi:hypothetical protein